MREQASSRTGMSCTRSTDENAVVTRAMNDAQNSRLWDDA